MAVPLHAHVYTVYQLWSTHPSVLRLYFNATGSEAGPTQQVEIEHFHSKLELKDHVCLALVMQTHCCELLTLCSDHQSYFVVAEVTDASSKEAHSPMFLSHNAAECLRW